MTLATARSISTSKPDVSRQRPARDGWYDPDSVTFVDRAERATDLRYLHLPGTRRLELGGVLPDEA